jgi:hypothetical protein
MANEFIIRKGYKSLANSEITGSLTISTGGLTTPANYFQLNTPSGYIQVGAMNSSHAHIYTDRPSFYTNKPILISGDTVLTTASGVGISNTQTISGAKTFSSLATFNNDILANDHIYGRSVNAESSRLYRFGGLYLTWDSDSHGTNDQHSLRSTYGNTFTDSVTLNSYNHIRFNIDTNNNNSTSYFEVGDGTTGTGNVIFRVDQAGNTTVTGNISIEGNITVAGTSTILDTQTVEVKDNILQLNTTQGSPDTATATTSGISVYRGNGVTQASLIFDDGDDTWDLTNNLTAAGNVTLTDGILTVNDGNNYVKISEGTNSIGQIELKDGSPVFVQGWGSEFRVGIGTYNNHALIIDTSKNATFAGKASFNTTQAPAAKIQAGAKTFGGGNGVHADSRLGIMNNGSLTSIVNASTYNDANFPDYGLVFIQGPSTSSYNVWSISPD